MRAALGKIRLLFLLDQDLEKGRLTCRFRSLGNTCLKLHPLSGPLTLEARIIIRNLLALYINKNYRPSSKHNGSIMALMNRVGANLLYCL